MWTGTHYRKGLELRVRSNVGKPQTRVIDYSQIKEAYVMSNWKD